MTFAERLRELREERNITQKELGAHLGISPRMVSFYESGATSPGMPKCSSTSPLFLA